MVTVLQRKQKAAETARQAKTKTNTDDGGKKTRSSPVASGPIDPDKMYAFSLVTKLFGIGRLTLRRFVREGMPTAGAGNRKFVLGSDLIAAMLQDARGGAGVSSRVKAARKRPT